MTFPRITGPVVTRLLCSVCNCCAHYVLVAAEDPDRPKPNLPGPIFDNPLQAFDAGWRPVSALRGTHQNVLRFVCGQKDGCDADNVRLGQRDEKYTGAERWWTNNLN